VQPQSPGLSDRIWWGSGSRDTARWAAEQGMNLMSSTLLLEDTSVPFDELQAEQIALFREAWAEAGHEREPRVSISRSVLPVTSDLDRRLFGREGNEDRDAAVAAADTILLTVPNQLGVEYNARLLETIARDVAPAFGWAPA
jgi:alkanesulfonate monooxygenase SsuD/methylene tetrahydromethanopterin reductase-like flavin-dependent oxidoreductase (luciferase family)